MAGGKKAQTGNVRGEDQRLDVELRVAQSIQQTEVSVQPE